MTKPDREYYPLPLAASMVGCTTDDLIHWAANGRASLGVLYTTDSFTLEYYSCYDGDDIFGTANSVPTRSFDGFAFVDSAYFKDMERNGGDLKFNSVTTLGGMYIVKNPQHPDGDHGTESRTFDKIFMHRHHLSSLLAEANEVINSSSIASSRAHVSNNLAILNQTAAKFWGYADRDDRTTHPKKNDVVAWLVEHGFSQITAESGATIIRPEWAVIGRKAEE